ncbi:GNAT family N-acetyltransferase [Bacteroidia bacterium]|nr:GNAT family N-acetyltransferase [Bacteroidia bacterium]
MNIQIETPRLLLRPFTLDDIKASYEMNLDQEISKYTGDGGVISYEEMEKRIKDVISGNYKKYGYGRFAVELKGVDAFIGFAGLKYLPEYGVTDLGYRFKKKYWGQGIATEAGKASIEYGFNCLNLSELKAYAMRENKASVHVLSKLGFIYEIDLTEDDLTYQQFTLTRIA